MWRLAQTLRVKPRILILNTQTCLWWSNGNKSLHHQTTPRTPALSASDCVHSGPVGGFPPTSAGLNKGTEPGSPPCPHLIVSLLARSHLASLAVRFSVFLLHNGLFHFNTPQDGLSPTGGKTVTVQNNAGGSEVQRLIAAAFGAATFRCASGCCL